MSRRNRIFNARTLVLGGLAVAAAAGALKNRHKVAGLIGARSSAPEPYPSPSTAPVGTPSVVHDEPAPPPTVSNYDAPGPPANTATPVPAPEPLVRGDHGIDEAAEEAAAAREAANIGFTTGTPPQYASDDLHETADEAHRPVEEAGGGIAEGFEQAEAELVDNAEPAAGDPLEGERQLEDVIEATDDPFSGERAESLTLTDPGPVDDDAGEPGVSTAAHIHVEGAREPAEQPDPPPADRLVIQDTGSSEETAPLAPETTEEGAPTTGGTSSGSVFGGSGYGSGGTTSDSLFGGMSSGSALGETPTESDADTGGGAGGSGSAGSALGETPAAEKSSAVWRSEPEPEAQTETEPEAEPTPEPEAQTETEPEPEPEPEAQTETEPEPELQPEPEAAEDTPAPAPDEQPTAEQPPVQDTPSGLPGATAERDDDPGGDDGSEWQTWSGRAVDR
jgi:hypothetical protein